MVSLHEERAHTVVALVSSNYLLRIGLQRTIEAVKWIRLVGHAISVTALDDMLIFEQPHVVIIDTEIESDLKRLIQKIKLASSQIRIILLTGLHNPECTRQAIDCGIDGIVLKIQPSTVLIATIEYLARPAGEIIPSTTATVEQMTLSKVPRLSIAISDNPCQAKWPEELTERERDVVTLISQGLSNKDIADRLCISSITVRHHLTNIFDKLGVSNRQKLLIRMHQYGIVELTAQA